METKDISSLLGEVDVVFVIDTTGSMGAFIQAAREKAVEMAEKIAADGDLNIRYGLVEYRDHPPQETTFVTKTVLFGDSENLQSALNNLRPHGGGDGPEAVLDGLVAAGNMEWRPNSDKICFLIGDSPPHGYGAPSQWPEGCPCRSTPNGVIELLRGKGIRLHAINLSGDYHADIAFRELAEGAGGTYSVEKDVREAVMYTSGVTEHSSTMVVHARTYTSTLASMPSGSTDKMMAETLGWSTDMVAGIKSYMAGRGIDTTGGLPKVKKPRVKKGK